MLEISSESQVNIKQQKIDAQTTQAGEKCVQASQKARKNVTRKKLLLSRQDASTADHPNKDGPCC